MVTYSAAMLTAYPVTGTEWCGAGSRGQGHVSPRGPVSDGIGIITHVIHAIIWECNHPQVGSRRSNVQGMIKLLIGRNGCQKQLHNHKAAG